ncbi:MAG: hypothetical protein HY820_22745 [Acidobacteria bacterium]|nr:hypothetical protein [Acidobacteriota bacterium]
MPVTGWLTVIAAAECGSLMYVRKFYPSADRAGKTLVRRLFFCALPTHAEYDRVNVEALCRAKRIGTRDRFSS